MKKPDSSPTPSSNPPVPAAPEARRSVDWLTNVRLLNATVVGGSAGALLGSLAGAFLGYPFLGGLLGALGVGLGALLFWEKLGQAAHAFFTPAGSGTMLFRDYSRAEALAVRGHYDDAVVVYQEAIADVPTDPEPYLRIAELLKDKVKDPEKTADWLRRAIEETELPELAELRRLMADGTG